MKKYIFTILASVLVFVLSGCGSNSKSDGTPGGVPPSSSTPGLSLTASKINVTNFPEFTLQLPIQKAVGNDYMITLNDFNLRVLGCPIDASVPVEYTPEPMVLDGKVGTGQILNIKGQFADHCPILAYQLDATQTTTKGGQTNVQVMSYVYKYDEPDNGALAPLSGFFNASTPLNITEPITEYEVSVQVVKEGHVVVGKTVNLQPFDRKYGRSVSYSSVTGEDGYAKFSYISPERLPEADDSVTLTLDMIDETTGKTVTQDVVLTFNEKEPVPPVNTQGYQLNVIPNAISITRPTESVSIDLQLLKNNAAVRNQSISVKMFSITYGTMNKVQALTDENGIVHFTYTAPAYLPKDNLEIVFEVEGGDPAVEQSVSVTFGKTPQVDTEHMTLTAAPASISIGRAGESKSINLYLSNSETKQPVEDVAIKVHTFDPNRGTFDIYEAITDERGHVAFIYTAPQNLPAGTLPVTFEVVNGKPGLTEQVNINFSSVATDYSLVNVNNITVNYPSERKEIAVQLIKNGVPQVGEQVTAKSIPATFGRIENVNVTTGGDGYARFTYIAADPLVNGSQTIEFTYGRY